MFQGMFRKRGRPPDPPLQIGGYDNIDQRQVDSQIPGHQLRDAPRQLPLPSVREFEQGTDVQQEQPGFSNAIVELSSSSHQQDVDMLDSYNRRLSQDPQHNWIHFQSNGNQFKSNPMDSNPVGSNPMDSNQVGSMPMSSNSIGLDQIHSIAMDSVQDHLQSNTTDSSQMPSDGLTAAQLNPDQSNQMSASTSPFDQLDPLRTHPDSGLSLRDPNSSSQIREIQLQL